MNKYVYSIYFGSNTENFNVSLGVCVLIEFVFFLLLLLSFVVLFFYFSSMGRKEGLGECGLKSDCQGSLNIEPHFLLIGFITCFAVDFSSLLRCTKLVSIRIINAKGLAHISLLFIRQHAH